MRRTILCLLPLAAAVATTPAAAQGGAWRISEVTGDVKIAEGGRTRAASRGALLSGGSVIAGARARAVLVRGRQYVVVAPNSTLRVDGSGGGASAGDMVQMILEAGSAVFRVNKRETPHFRVQTRYLAAVVRGTTFSVTVTPTGGSVQVTEGAVEVSTPDGGAKDLVRPGMIASVSSGDLYQLSISGDQSRTIRSPGAPAAPAAQGGAAVSSRPLAAGRVARIGAPIGEAPVRLSQATNGLLRGGAAIDLAFARGSDRSRAARGDGGRPDHAGRPDRSRPESRGNDGNRGHGNDEDRNDEDNPGRGGGPGGKDDDDRNDDRGNGGGGNGGKDEGAEGGKEDRGDDPGRGGADKGDDEEGEDKDRGNGGKDGEDDRPADDEDDADDGKGEDRGDDDAGDADDGKDKDRGNEGDGKDGDSGEDDGDSEDGDQDGGGKDDGGDDDGDEDDGDGGKDDSDEDDGGKDDGDDDDGGDDDGDEDDGDEDGGGGKGDSDEDDGDGDKDDGGDGDNDGSDDDDDDSDDDDDDDDDDDGDDD